VPVEAKPLSAPNVTSFGPPPNDLATMAEKGETLAAAGELEILLPGGSDELLSRYSFFSRVTGGTP